LVVLAKAMVALYVPRLRVPTLFKENVTVIGDVVRVPDVKDALSQLGMPEIETFTLPVVELS
jgi:hypothetical protein